MIYYGPPLFLTETVIIVSDIYHILIMFMLTQSKLKMTTFNHHQMKSVLLQLQCMVVLKNSLRLKMMKI